MKLAFCNIGDEAAVGIFSGLIKNNALTTLNLSANSLTDNIESSLMECLKSKYNKL